jgi:hypothetical protein
MINLHIYTFFYSRTVYLDIINVLSPIDEQENYF